MFFLKENNILLVVVRGRMQKVLFEIDGNKKLQPSFSISKSVRNASYQNVKPRIGHEQQIVYTILLQYPASLTDHEISNFTGLSLSSVNGRRNELMQMGLVSVVGIASYTNSSDDKLHLRTLWGAVL